MPRWLKGELRSYVLDVLSPQNLSRHGIFDGDVVARILADHFEGRETNDTLIWALIVFQVWFNAYLSTAENAPLDAASAGSDTGRTTWSSPLVSAGLHGAAVS